MYLIVDCKYMMLYILLIDSENSMEFWVLECARIYQQSLGGHVYAVDISRSADTATDDLVA